MAHIEVHDVTCLVGVGRHAAVNHHLAVATQAPDGAYPEPVVTSSVSPRQLLPAC